MWNISKKILGGGYEETVEGNREEWRKGRGGKEQWKEVTNFISKVGDETKGG